MKAILSFLLTFWFSLCATITPAKENPWLLTDFPTFDGGVKSAALYDAGSGREPDWEDESADNNRYMQAVYYTTSGEVEQYCSKLETEGFEKTYENHIDTNDFYAYDREGQRLYISFAARLGEVRLMDDSCSCPVAEFGYSEKGEATPAVFQFGFPYWDRDICSDKALYSSNGMCYIIRLSDNKLVIIDGGSIRQSSDKNVDIFMELLHEVTGTEPGEKITVAMWYGTHGHSDHITVFSKALELHKSEFVIERLAYNYQSYVNCEYDHRVDWLRAQTNKLCPTAKYMKVRTGEAWTLADTRFEVLCSHEEVVDAKTGILPADDANDCTSVLKMTMNGSTFLFTGDMDLLLQDAVMKRYTRSTVRADVMQAPHHMLNFVYRLYPAVSAQYILAPQSRHRSEKYLDAYMLARLTTKKENILFGSDGTYGLFPQDGKISVTFTPLTCVPYDGSDFEYDF